MHELQNIQILSARLVKAAEVIGAINVEVDTVVNRAGDDHSVLINDVAHIYFLVKLAHEALDTQIKALYHIKDKLDKKIVPEFFERLRSEDDIVRVPEIGRSFSVNEKTSATFIDKDVGYAWLREIGQGDLIQETVNAGTLSAFVRNRQLEEGLDPPEDIVKVSIYKTTSINKYTPKAKGK